MYLCVDDRGNDKCWSNGMWLCSSAVGLIRFFFCFCLLYLFQLKFATRHLHLLLKSLILYKYKQFIMRFLAQMHQESYHLIYVCGFGYKEIKVVRGGSLYSQIFCVQLYSIASTLINFGLILGTNRLIVNIAFIAIIKNAQQAYTKIAFISN